jgi:hypothetical protein
VARKVLGAVLPFAVLEVGRLHQDACAVLPRVFTLSAHVLNANHHRLCDLVATGRPAITACFADDHSLIAEAELNAVVLPIRTRSTKLKASESQATPHARRDRSKQG